MVPSSIPVEADGEVLSKSEDGDSIVLFLHSAQVLADYALPHVLQSSDGGKGDRDEYSSWRKHSQTLFHHLVLHERQAPLL